MVSRTCFRNGQAAVKGTEGFTRKSLRPLYRKMP